MNSWKAVSYIFTGSAAVILIYGIYNSFTTTTNLDSVTIGGSSSFQTKIFMTHFSPYMAVSIILYITGFVGLFSTNRNNAISLETQTMQIPEKPFGISTCYEQSFQFCPYCSKDLPKNDFLFCPYCSKDISITKNSHG